MSEADKTINPWICKICGAMWAEDVGVCDYCWEAEL